MDEWENEPNRKEGKYKGMTYLVLRHPTSLHLCGYVRLPERSRLRKIGYDDIRIDTHCGLTFAGNLSNEKGYWIGFDCAHSGDISPYMWKGYDYGTKVIFKDYTYKNIAYVEKWCRKMIDQLKKGVWVSVRVERKYRVRC